MLLVRQWKLERVSTKGPLHKVTGAVDIQRVVFAKTRSPKTSVIFLRG
jgi:hypothetical protein